MVIFANLRYIRINLSFPHEQSVHGHPFNIYFVLNIYPTKKDWDYYQAHCT